MRILVTRPQPGASETAARLAAMGHEALVEPLTRIAFNAAPAGLAMPGALAFTSRNAVAALAAWDVAGAWRALPVFAVGAATAAGARDAGFTKVAVAEGDVVHLAAFIRGRLDPRRGHVLYPAARDRAGDLAAALAPAGIVVETVEAYRAVPVEAFSPAALAALRAGSLDAALFHSRRSAEVFAGLVAASGVGAGIRSVRLLALSPRVGEALGRIDAAKVEIAATPDETALAALVRGRPEDGRKPIRAV